jgi:acyl carrier protein
MSIVQADSLRAVLSEVLDVPARTLTEDSSPETVSAWDSLATMRLMVALEEVFNVTFLAEEVAGLTSVAAVRAILRQKGVAV